MSDKTTRPDCLSEAEWQAVLDMRKQRVYDNGWREMPTTPEPGKQPWDGEELLLYTTDETAIIAWYDGDFRRRFPWQTRAGARYVHSYTTHWRPLPPPPAVKGTEP